MNKKSKILIAFAIIVFAAAAIFIRFHNIEVFNPKGIIASRERQLMYIAIALGLVVVIPVYVMTIVISVKYREGNSKKRKYSPDWDHHRGLEATWWAIPSIIIIFLAVLTWTSSHALDPYKSIDSSVSPLPIQVVALDWKWLFIYPQQNIASVNYFQMPLNTPINFKITSDAPMNSFWIPQLGGQIYAMPGMSTQLNLMASQPGSYHGSSANISGNGFAGMDFIAKATSQNDFNSWVKSVRQMSGLLSLQAYNQLAKPSQNNPVRYYGWAQPGLFDSIIGKYQPPYSLPNSISSGHAE